MNSRYSWLLFLVLPCVRPILGQDIIAPGSLQQNFYSNDALGLTWEFPKEWVVQKHETAGRGSRQTLLLQLTAGDDSVALVTEDYRDTPGFSSGYSDIIKAALESKGWKSSGSRGFRTIGGGIGALEDHFSSKTSPARYLSVACGALRGYELKFMVEAKTPERLEELGKSLREFKVRPDWSSGESVEVPGDPSKPGMIRVSEGVSEKMLSKRVPPAHPQDAHGKKALGSVVMVLHLNTVGHVRDLYVIEGDPILASAAVEAVSHWEYRPYKLNGEPISVETQVIVNFQ
jgi:hypothetical protein